MAAQSLPATAVIRPECKQFNPNKSALSTITPHKTLQSQWRGTISRSAFSIQSSKLRHVFTKRPRINAAISSVLPTAKPDRVGATEKVPEWSWKAIKSFALAEVEARKLKSETTGTEALLLGILIEGTSFASKYLRANGITLFKVRDEILKLLGPLPELFVSPMQPPSTEAAQNAIDWAVDEKLKSGGDGQISTTHMLLGVWQQVGSPGYQVLANLGFNDEKAKELQSIISNPRFVDD